MLPPPEHDGRPRPEKLLRYGDPQVARTYDRRWAGPAARRRNRRKARALERALERLAELSGEDPREWTVLDAPSGTGRFQEFLAARCRHYLGADLAPAMLAEAPPVPGDAGLVVADLARLPLEDQAVDVVSCIRFLHLVRAAADRIACLSELARVARVGVVADYRHDRTLRVAGRRLRHRLGLLPRAPANPSPAAIRQEVETAGGVVVEEIAVHRAPWLSDKVLVVIAPSESGPVWWRSHRRQR